MADAGDLLGTGIGTESGADPLDVWNARLNFLGNELLASEVRRLLDGASVEARDEELQIGWLPSVEVNRGRLTMRRSGAPYVADIELQAIPKNAVKGEADARESSPCPAAWQNIESDSVVVWELFNCTVHGLRTRDNQLGTP